MTDLSIEDYSEKAIVVRGDTRPHKDALKSLGGKWNSRLRDGPGWIFSKKLEDKVAAYVISGEAPEQKEREQKSRGSPSRSTGDVDKLTKEVRRLKKEMTALEGRLSDKMDRILALLGDDEAEVEVEDDSSSEEDQQMKRLLHK